MKVKLFAVFVLFGLIGYYIISYCCIYTAVVMFEILKPFGAEYRCKDMTGTQYFHAYVHVGGYNIFLNPFRVYDSQHRVYKSTDKFIQYSSNWGQLYVPCFDIFVNRDGVV